MIDEAASSLEECFSASYKEARERFLTTAQSEGAQIASWLHPGERGSEGEELAMDAALLGDPDAPNLLIISSGTHGIEGYCGSACQTALLRDHSLARAATGNTAILLIHAINPYGFSHGRRCDEQNIDVNRNFVHHRKPYPVNAAYTRLHAVLAPQEWPPTPEVQAELGAILAGERIDALQAAVTAGQYAFPDGLFFGGHSPAWSNLTLRALLQRFAGKARRIHWIDIHTGLGPTGKAELIHAGRNDAESLRRARAIWGDRVTSTHEGSSVSAVTEGLMPLVAYEEAPQARISAVVLEFGTVPLLQVLHALRGENWLHHHRPHAEPSLRAAVAQQMREAFYVDRLEWKAEAVRAAREAARQAWTALTEGVAAYGAG